jgi:RNA polymerase sigma-70 factor (ECF subfamily)
MKALPPLRPWLFRIAHNRAIDHLRREQVRKAEPLEAASELAGDVADEPEQALAQQQAVRAAIASFLALPPSQRACVILKDVLDHSLDEIAGELDLSVQAVKAALHRARVALDVSPPEPLRGVSPGLQRYAALFNAHDWDGVRAMLADDVKLDLVSRRKIAGREVATYFSNYAGVSGWRVAPTWLDGGEVLAVWLGDEARPNYFIALQWQRERVAAIRDFRYVPYIGREAAFRLAD